MERSKKKVQLWKRAIVHFSLCFVMGFFTGFAPTAKTSFFSTHNTTSPSDHKQQLHRSPLQPRQTTVLDSAPPAHLVEHTAFAKQTESTTTTTAPPSSPRRLVIMVTPTRMRGEAGLVLLRRLADTVRLAEPPLLWIVVEGAAGSKEVSEVLRKTGVMYRQLVVKENFTDRDAELNHHRNVALKHIEQHRLSGIVHFADLSNVYDLDFFHHLRDIEVFGTWAVALLSANRKKVTIEGPVCDSSQVIGWHLGKMMKQTKEEEEEEEEETDDQKVPPPPPPPLSIHISNFAFNSSILWDPERWGRPTSVQGTSQNSLKFVKQVVFDDETKLKGIPAEECSKIMLWRLHLPLVPPSTLQPTSITR